MSSAPPPRRTGLRRAGVSIVLAALVPTLALFGWTAIVALDSVNEKLAAGHLQSAQALADRFDLVVRQGREKLRATAGLPGLAMGLDAFAGGGDGVAPAGQTIHYLFLGSPIFTGGLLVVDRQGTVLWSEPVDTRLIGGPVPAGAASPLVREVLERGREDAGAAGASMLALGQPLTDFGGATVGALIGLIDLAHPATRATIGVSAAGDVSRGELIVGGTPMALSGDAAPAYGPELLREVTSPKAGVLRHVLDGAGRSWFVAHAPLAEAPWSIALGRDEGELFASASATRDRLALIGGLMALVLALLAVPVMNRFVRPVEEMAAATRAFARGTEHPLPEGAPGELGDLVHAFGRTRREIRGLLERLTASEARYRSSIDLAPDAIVAIDPGSGRVVDANRLALELTGLTLDALRGMKAEDLHPAEEVSAAAAHIASLRVGVGATMEEAKLMRADGTIVPVAIRSALIEAGGARFVQQIWRDLTERKALERRMVQTEKMSSLGVLAAGITHEMKSPLMAVLSYAELLSEELGKMAASSGNGALGLLAEDSRELQVAAKQVATITSDITRFAHPGAEKREPLDVRAVLEQSVRIAHSSTKKHARVVCELPEVPLIEADAGRLTQVFLNLLVNAGHAIESTGRFGQIRVAARAEGGEVVVEVSDTGCGIPRALMSKIFDPFFTTKDPGKGTGLGLALAYRIVHDHHGTIDVSSEAGTGTRFTVRFPACPGPAVARAA